MRAKTCIEGSNPSVSAKIISNWFQVVRTISDPFEAFEVLFYSTFLTRLASSKASMSVIRYSTFPTIFK